MFAVTCQADLNLDGTTDCVVGGMSGVRVVTYLTSTNCLNFNENNFFQVFTFD